MTIINSLSQNTILVNTFSSLQAEAAELNLQIATGRIGDSFGDYDPTAGASIVDLRTELSRIDQFSSSVSLLESRALRTEQALIQLDLAGQDVRTTQLGISTGTTTPVQLQQLARIELENVLNELNASFAGEFIFAGSESGQPAVIDFDDLEAAITAQLNVPANDPDLPPQGPTPGPAEGPETVEEIIQVIRDYFDAGDPTGREVPPDLPAPLETAPDNLLPFYQGGTPQAGPLIDDSLRADPLPTAFEEPIREYLAGLATLAFVPVDGTDNVTFEDETADSYLNLSSIAAENIRLATVGTPADVATGTPRQPGINAIIALTARARNTGSPCRFDELLGLDGEGLAAREAGHCQPLDRANRGEDQ